VSHSQGTIFKTVPTSGRIGGTMSSVRRQQLRRGCCLSLFTPVNWHQDGLILCFANQSCYWDFTVNILDQLPTIRRKIH